MGMRDMTVYRDVVRLHDDLRATVYKQMPAHLRYVDSLAIEQCFDKLIFCISFISRSRDDARKARMIEATTRYIDTLYYKIELQSVAHRISLSQAADIYLRIQNIEKQLMGLHKRFLNGQNPRTQG